MHDSDGGNQISDAEQAYVDFDGKLVEVRSILYRGPGKILHFFLPEVVGVSVEDVRDHPRSAFVRVLLPNGSKVDSRACDVRPIEDAGLEEFTEYFSKNYSGPNTIIHNPKWHAPKIYRAAISAYKRSQKSVMAVIQEHLKGQDHEFKA